MRENFCWPSIFSKIVSWTSPPFPWSRKKKFERFSHTIDFWTKQLSCSSRENSEVLRNFYLKICVYHGECFLLKWLNKKNIMALPYSLKSADVMVLKYKKILPTVLNSYIFDFSWKFFSKIILGCPFRGTGLPPVFWYK